MKLEAKQRLQAGIGIAATWSGYQVTCSDGTQYETFSPVNGEPFGIRGTTQVTVNKTTLEAFNSQGLAAKLRVVAGRNTGVGAGVLFCARDTGRVLFVLRSPSCESPNTWCGLGGGVESGETIEQGVRREVQEEGGFSDPYDLVHMHSDDQGDFTFHNHYAWVPTEFEPTLNEEHTEHRWCDKIPQPIHPGLLRSILAYQESRNEN
jgi:dATP pyrophosphohydrolase